MSIALRIVLLVCVISGFADHRGGSEGKAGDEDGLDGPGVGQVLDLTSREQLLDWSLFSEE